MRRLFLIVLSFLCVNVVCGQIDYKKEINELARGIYNDPDVYEKALALRADIGRAPVYYQAKLGSVIGKVAMRRGDLVKAYLYFGESLEHLYDADTLDHYLEYAIYNNLAKISYDVGNYHTSANEYDHAAEAASRYIKHHPEVASQYKESYLDNKMRFYQGNALYEAGDILEAQRVYQSIDETLQPFNDEVKDIATYALLRNEYGLNEKAQGNWDNALYYFTAIVDNPNIGAYYKGPALHNMALVMKERKEYAEALKYFDRAIAVKKNTTSRQLYISLMDRGEMLLDMGLYDEAIVSMSQAFELGLDTNQDPVLINLYYLAERAYKYKDLEQSEAYGRKYRELKKDQLKHQAELQKLQANRLFTLAFAQARHEKMVAELERELVMQKLWLVGRWIGLASMLVWGLTLYVRRRRARRIAEA